ncbi:MAG: hypothetical protein COW01_10785 [Bdellovibrionales bacterium CG12_big_fil_rev_8_21_14_0_65_38_15]|nr:MAG: hypothetical protein COW79_07630 [Bdellovibrionales bacterium CG22_combo_CG10-13_8_21_14_all_38_13]PIQ54621.1 MAG: hypothetical protein COW01_10785 [Bdellovibrionales bacterium CG12_big_fil_rev_8_21_14_0_65_38_15]PIR30002.1 MAG: hypothetical protein COV38_08630 [Bdellovibrionales bacterium CG11_big_fil_rev_8_21_14_0_20_38_13]
MAEFNRDKLEMFLGIVRKYMQIRGPMTQKDLADITNIGVSTMSRFLNLKTSELNAQLIAKIVAKLAIPLHEIIEFVEEEYTEHFVRLVKFYREEEAAGAPMPEGSGPAPSDLEEEQPLDDDEYLDALGTSGTAQKNASAKINVGGKQRTISFQADQGARNSQGTLRERLQNLSARQKAFLTDFLNLDSDGRDLIVDLGKNVISYLRQKGMDL